MRRSSIFNSETLRARLWIPRTLFVLLAWLAGAEAVLRIPAVTAVLPDPAPSLWHAPLVAAKLANLKRVEETSGIDVLFIGNSSMQSGVDPTEFDRERCGDSSAGCTSYNGSIEGLPPYGVRLFLEIYLHYCNPHTVVYGLLPQDLNSGSPWAKDVTARVKNSVMDQAEAKRGWKGELLATALESSSLFRYRFVLHRLMLRGGAASAPEQVYFDGRGFHAIPADPGRQSLQVRPGRHPGLLNYSLEGEQAREVAELVSLCKRRGIRLILADMPVTREYADYYESPADYDAYEVRLRAIAAGGGVQLWDSDEFAQAQLDTADFSDTSHLNAIGAKKLTDQMANLFRRDAQEPARSVVSLGGAR